MEDELTEAKPKARAKKGKQIVEIRHNSLLPGPAAAANLALIILSKAGKNTWAELVVDPESYAHIRVGESQRRLLIEFCEILPVLALSPQRSVFACKTCGRWAYIDGKGNVPARCNLSLGCGGSPERATTQQPKLVPPDVPAAAGGPGTGG